MTDEQIKAMWHKATTVDGIDATVDIVNFFARAIEAQVREECAKVCDEYEYDNWDNERPLRICAAAIRRMK